MRTAQGIKKILAVSGIRQCRGQGSKRAPSNLRDRVVPAEPVHFKKGVIAANKFVAPIAAEGDFHMFGRELRDKISGNRGTIGKWFIKIPDEVRNQIQRVG